MATYNDSYPLPRNPVPSSPISVLDIFFPGFTNVSAAFQQLQSSNINGYTQMICICGIVMFFGRYAYTTVKRFVDTYFTSTIHISDTDEAYDMLMAWLSSQPFTDDVSSSLASVGARTRRFGPGRADKSLKKPLQYSPWNGTFTFWYKKRLITFRSMQRDNPFNNGKEDISISCIGRSSKILKELLNESREKYLASVKNKTTIFKHCNGGWDKKNAVAIRPSNSVIIDQKEKTALLEDIKGFLESQPWYFEKGIPHRKGYLFYGPPGTGKSSLSQVIAGECDLDIYILKLSRLNDDSLDELFGELPERCLVLLEDIDAVDAACSRLLTPRSDDTSSSVKENHGRVSLSALLNAIDGIGAQQGRLLIMTTNHPNRLDDALIRPGRVDVTVGLGLTTHDINAQLFFNTFERSAPNDKDKAEEDKELKEIAEEFANKVPENEFSPAEIQLFLVANRKSPAMAVHSLQEWIAKVREEKTASSVPSLGMTTLHHNGFSGKSPGTIDSSAARRAPLTNNTADNGAIAQDLLSQDVATTDVIFASQSGISPYNSTAAQRAPTLSNYTADDGGQVYGSLDQDAATTDMIFGSQTDISQRALTLSNYNADGAMAYDAVGRYRHDWVAAPSPCESGGSGRVPNVALNEAHSSPATPQDCTTRETTNTIAVLETSKTVENFHCCSCQVTEDIIGICMRERIPSVEKSLLLTYLSDLKTCRGISAVQDHSTDKFFNLLLDFVKTYYASTAEHCPMQPAASLTYPNLRPNSASRGILPLIQPEPKTATEFESLSAPTAKKDYVVGELEKFWDEDGWEPIAFGSNDATPGISHYLQPPADLSSEAVSNEPSGDDASSVTTFESGSQTSCDIEDAIRRTEVVKKSPDLGIKRELYRQPATPPASPVSSSADLLAGSHAKRYGALYSGMEMTLKTYPEGARLAGS